MIDALTLGRRFSIRCPLLTMGSVLSLFMGLTAMPAGAQTDCVNIGNACDPGGGNVDASCFAVTSTCQDLSTPCTTAGVLPTVSSVQQDSGDSTPYTVTLSRQIVPGQWTTIHALVEDSDGRDIRTDPWDRIDLGFLPGDVDGNRTTNSADKDQLEALLAVPTCHLETMDMNRDGVCTSADVTRLQQLQNGTQTTQAWNNISLPARP